MKSIFFKALTGTMLLVCSQALLAATLYRCGNSFQDTPCLNGNSKTVKAPAAASGTNLQKNDLAPYTIDADCKQRGDASKKIMWLREVGKTQEQQLENAQDGALVREVYNQHGSSLEVRNAIEQLCMKQKEKDELADKLMTEAQRLK